MTAPKAPSPTLHALVQLLEPAAALHGLPTHAVWQLARYLEGRVTLKDVPETREG